MAEPKQSSASDEKTSMFRSNTEEKKPMVHEEETHGTSGDIDEMTRVDHVKGPGFLGRVKEEMEAIVDAVTPSKTSEK